MMRQMRLATAVTPIQEASTKVDLDRFDYVLSGQLVSTRFSTNTNIFPLTFLTVLGAPNTFITYEMEFKVALFSRANRSTSMFEQTYRFEGHGLQSLYYGQSAYFDLFIAGLEETLPQVVNDLAIAIKTRPAKRVSRQHRADEKGDEARVDSPESEEPAKTETPPKPAKTEEPAKEPAKEPASRRECAAGRTWTGSTCADAPAEKAQCAAGRTWNGSRCEWQACRSDGDCPRAALCESGRCTAPPPPAETTPAPRRRP
jgi:hypothetical protein